MTEPTPKKRNMKKVNQHRESIREKFGIPDDKQVEINRLRAALSARAAEIREVLEGLRFRHGCWCELPPNAGSLDHTAACLAAQRLYEKLQPTLPTENPGSSFQE